MDVPRFTDTPIYSTALAPNSRAKLRAEQRVSRNPTNVLVRAPHLPPGKSPFRVWRETTGARWGLCAARPHTTNRSISAERAIIIIGTSGVSPPLSPVSSP